jgi:hypothetical protein
MPSMCCERVVASIRTMQFMTFTNTYVAWRGVEGARSKTGIGQLLLQHGCHFLGVVSMTLLFAVDREI